MIANTTSLYLGASRCFYKFSDILMKSSQIIFTDFGTR